MCDETRLLTNILVYIFLNKIHIRTLDKLHPDTEKIVLNTQIVVMGGNRIHDLQFSSHE